MDSRETKTSQPAREDYFKTRGISSPSSSSSCGSCLKLGSFYPQLFAGLLSPPSAHPLWLCHLLISARYVMASFAGADQSEPTGTFFNKAGLCCAGPTARRWRRPCMELSISSD